MAEDIMSVFKLRAAVSIAVLNRYACASITTIKDASITTIKDASITTIKDAGKANSVGAWM